MSSLRAITIASSLLSVALLLQTVYGVPEPLYSHCENDRNFTVNGLYEANLNKLLGYLYYQAPPTGFGLGSVGQNSKKAHGLALCRGDVSTPDCKSCVAGASNNIRKSCPESKRAMIWYDNCLLKYSDEPFFGEIDTTMVMMWNVNNVSNPATFNQKTKELLSQLANEASVTPKMYAAGGVELGNYKKLYGMAQCTRDLSHSNCKQCLDGIIADLPSCCDGKEGGRILSGSCSIRYEIYSFVSA